MNKFQRLRFLTFAVLCLQSPLLGAEKSKEALFQEQCALISKRQIQIDSKLGNARNYEKLLLRGLKLVGSLTSYSDKDKLLKIVAHFNEGPIIEQQYYWWEKQLMIYKEVPRKQKGGTPIPPQIYFFDQGHILKWMDAQNLTDPVILEKERIILPQSQQYIALILTPEQNINLDSVE